MRVSRNWIRAAGGAFLTLIAFGCPAAGTGISGESGDFHGLIPLMRAHAPGLTAFQVKERVSLDPEYELVLFRGRGARGAKSYVGVFVVASATGAPLLTLDILHDPPLSYIRLREAWHDFVIVDRVGHYGVSRARTKYRIDLDGGKVVDAAEYRPYPARAAVSGDTLFLFVNRRNGAFITELNSLAASDRRVYARLQGERIRRIKTVGRSDEGLVLRTDRGRYLFDAGQWRPLAGEGDEGEPGRFVYRRGGTHYEVRAEENEITLRSAGDVAEYPLPRADYDLFARLRPERVDDGYTREHSFIEETLGPSHLRGSRLWFGYDFYDGEGVSGVGGIGYFDLARRRYEIKRLPEVIGWSVSAILADRDAVWAGRYRRPEGAAYPGGLIRYRLPNGPVDEIEVPKIINSIARWGRYIACGTRDGAYLVRDDGTLIRITWDEGGGTETPTAVIRQVP